MKWGTVDTRRGVNADRAFDEARKPAARAAVADAATIADELNTVTPRGGSIDGGVTLAIVVDGRIEPLAVDDLFAYLETRYVLTPIP